ncbi:MAG: high-potential iron-sulfur protein [Gammaproteobacteria bacterium]|nr:high-potential iron-sulfur protein [Gammaproteobacteria bacterium]
MIDNKLSRRALLIRAVQLPAMGATLMAINAFGEKADLLCADPDVLSESEMGLRRSLGYLEVSDDPDKTCSVCAFFRPGSEDGCGRCQLFQGGPVSPGGRCASWSEIS